MRFAEEFADYMIVRVENVLEPKVHAVAAAAVVTYLCSPLVLVRKHLEFNYRSCRAFIVQKGVRDVGFTTVDIELSNTVL